jgi:hypothetical protein
MSAPKVFISYSHDSPEHKAWALRLATSLRAVGIDTVLDQWDLRAGQDMTEFMAKGISAADRVVMICTEAYVTKAEEGRGGVGYERLIVTAEVVAAIDTIKFIPIVRNNPGLRKVPIHLGSRAYIDFSDDSHYDTKLEELAREIHAAPALVKPGLGENPFKGEVINSAEPVRITGPNGATAAGQPILSGEWFEAQHATAAKGITTLFIDPAGVVPHVNAVGAMEVRMGLHAGLNKSQMELLNAVRTSEIKTFGWPFAVTLENREGCKPRPFGDGIRAEVSIKERNSYDYWAARKNGDFYAMQGYFEDQQGRPDALFFNTRIVRLTEALMFAGRFYASLGALSESKFSIRVTHRGLAGRALKSIGNRVMFDTRSSHEPVSETETVIVLGTIHDTLAEEVQRICAPMFMLFDFQEFSPMIYEDIVRRFENGETS